MKSGDKVKLVRRGKLGEESNQYTMIAGLILGNIYEIKQTESGLIKLKGYNYWFNANHFEPIK